MRRPTWFCLVLAVPFLGACLGVAVLVGLYHWPHVNVPVYYFTVRPAFVWFAGLLPLLVVGVVGVRLRWFVCGCLLWVVGFAATEEVMQCAKPSSGRARAKFSAIQMGFSSYVARDDPKQEQLNVPLRIITWNVSGGSGGAQEAVEQLWSLEPDLVFMQEFVPSRFKEAVERCGRFEGYFLEGGTEAVLSRFPVTRLPNGPLPGERGSVWRVEVAPEMGIICLNVHLSPLAVKTQLIRGWRWRGLKNAISRTERELEQLRSALDFYAEEGPIILAGDFNLPPHYPDLRRVTAGLKDCFAETGYGWGKTAPAKLPAVRVDLIFVPGDAKVYYACAVPTHYSDHYMTLAEVELPVRRGSTNNATALGSSRSYWVELLYLCTGAEASFVGGGARCLHWRWFGGRSGMQRSRSNRGLRQCGPAIRPVSKWDMSLSVRSRASSLSVADVSSDQDHLRPREVSDA